MRKICKRTVIRRLAEKGISPKLKLRKNDFSVAQRKKRVLFGKVHEVWGIDAVHLKTLHQNDGSSRIQVSTQVCRPINSKGSSNRRVVETLLYQQFFHTMQRFSKYAFTDML